MPNINKIRLSGTTYTVQDPNASKTVELTQAAYDALVEAGTVDPNTFYIITDSTAGDLSNYYTKTQIDTILNNLSLVRISQTDYEALETKNSNTLYFIGDTTNGYTMKIGNVNVN